MGGECEVRPDQASVAAGNSAKKARSAGRFSGPCACADALRIAGCAGLVLAGRSRSSERSPVTGRGRSEASAGLRSSAEIMAILRVFGGRDCREKDEKGGSLEGRRGGRSMPGMTGDRALVEA